MAKAKKKRAPRKKVVLKAADMDAGTNGDAFQRWLMAGQPSARDDPEGVWEAFLAVWGCKDLACDLCKEGTPCRR